VIGRSRRWLLAISLVLALLAVLAIVAIALGISLDASRWRDAAANQASQVIGRPVALHGAMRLTLGRRLQLKLEDVRVAGAAGFEASELAALREVAVGFDFLDLLRGVARPRSVEVAHAVLNLERPAEGRGNWAANAPRPTGVAPLELDFGDLHIQRASVNYHDARSGQRRSAELQEIQASSAADGALRVSLRGRVDTGPELDLKLTGGPLRLPFDAAPWPYTLEVRAESGRLHATGAFDAGQGELRAEFEATLDQPALLGRALGLEWHELDAMSLRGAARARADEIELGALRGTLAGSEVSGALSLILSGPRPRLGGTLQFGELDPGPWIAALDAAPRTGAGARWRSLALRDPLPFDTELELRVGRVLGLPLEVRDATIALHGDAAGLRAPLSASVSGVQLAGELKLVSSAEPPALSLELATREQARGAVARVRWVAQGVEGSIGSLELRLSGRGATLGEWARDLEAQLTATGISASLPAVAARRPTHLHVDRLNLRAGRGERLRGEARAVLGGEPVAISLQGGRLTELQATGRLPIELSASSAPATLRLATELHAGSGAGTAPVRFDLRAPRSGGLARWLGVAPDSTLPVQLSGRLGLGPGTWRVDDARLALGRTRLDLEASGARAPAHALTQVRVRGGPIDLPELLSLRSAAAQGAGGPALPGAGASTDVQVELQQVALGSTTLHELRGTARLRNGVLLPARFSARLNDTAIEGVAEADLRAAPWARLEVSAREIELGPLLRDLGVADGTITGHADSLQATLRVWGREPREWIDGAELKARVSGGRLALRASPQRPEAELQLREATLALPPGGVLALHLDGSVEDLPMLAELRGGTLAQMLSERGTLPLLVSVQALQTRVLLEGTATLPLGGTTDLQLKASGERLDRLDRVLPIELPAWGPWSITGPLRVSREGVQTQGLELRVRDSLMHAEGRIDLRATRPELELRLRSPRLALEDFPLPLRDTSMREGPRRPMDATRTVAEHADRLLAARWLRTFDARIDTQADAVIGSGGEVATAQLRAQLKGGRLHVGPARLALPGGSIRASLSGEAKPDSLDFAIAADFDRFDYAFLPGQGAGSGGLLSMNMQLHGNAPTMTSMPLHARGQVDLAAWPDDLRSSAFDLWSANLLLRVITLAAPTAPPRLNCLVGRFDFHDGIVREDRLIVDTTEVRILGDGEVDLASGELAFVFRPRAKGFAMFNLQQPLRVTGTVSEQRIGLDPRDTPEALARLVFSPILWLFERWTLGPLPRDGADVCTDPLRPAPAPA
jgi:uncharacterized protein involved in outer membrane biogenesis